MKNLLLIFSFLLIVSACNQGLDLDEPELMEQENLVEIRNWYESIYLPGVTTNNIQLKNVLSKTPKWDLAKSQDINNSSVLIVPLQKETGSEKLDYIIVNNDMNNGYELSFINITSESGEVHEEDVFGFGKFTGLSTEIDMEGNLISGAFYKDGVVNYHISEWDSKNEQRGVKIEDESFKVGSVWNLNWIRVEYHVDYGSSLSFTKGYVLSSSYEWPPQLPVGGNETQIPSIPFNCPPNMGPAGCATTIVTNVFGVTPGAPVPSPPINTYCYENPVWCDWPPNQIDYGDVYEQTTIIEIGLIE